MFKCLQKEDWSLKSLKSSYKPNNKRDYLLHLYMGSSKSSNVVLRRPFKYGSISAFVEDIVMQLPQSRRKPDKLKELFNLFYPYHDAYAGYSNVDSDVLEIRFSEYGVKLSSDTSKLPRTYKDSVNIHTLFKDLSENITSIDTDEPLDDEKSIELAKKIKTSVMDVFRGVSSGSVSVEASGILKNHKTITLDVFDADDKPFSVEIPILKHERAKDFLLPLFDKIASDKKSEEFFKKTFGKLFENAAMDLEMNDEHHTIFVPPGLSSVVPKSATAVIIKSVPKPVVIIPPELSSLVPKKAAGTLIASPKVFGILYTSI